MNLQLFDLSTLQMGRHQFTEVCVSEAGSDSEPYHYSQ